MAPSASRVTRALFVASQSGFKGHWDGIAYWRVAAIWHLMIPIASRVWGYLPGFLGVGEEVPAGVAREWARWGRHPDYLMRDGGPERRAVYAALRFPIRSLAIADDTYAPERAAAALLEFYAGAPRELRVVRPTDLGRATLGHFGPFRATEGAALWPEIADWILLPE